MFFYIIKRLINVVVVFNINTFVFVFVIDFYVCAFECFYSALVVTKTSNNSIIQNKIVFEFFSKIIIKLIFYCIYCDKNYYNRNYYEFLYSKLKKKQLANRRNQNNNNSNNNNNNNNNNNRYRN